MDSPLLLEDFNIIEQYDLIESRENPKKYYLRGVFSRVDRPNRNKRIYPRDVMEESINGIQEDIKNRGFVGALEHPCFNSNDFDVLAKEGWKHFTELKIGDEIVTFDENNVIVYQPIQKIIDEPFTGKVYHFKNRNMDSTVTGTHRFYLEDRYGKRQIVTAKEIYDNRVKYAHSKIIKNGIWNADTNENFVIPGIDESEYNNRFNEDVRKDLVLDTKNFMAFMGIFLSEGNIGRREREGDYRIFISQNDGETADKIRDLLKKLNFNFSEIVHKRRNSIHISFSFRDIRLHRYLKPLGNCHNKYIPNELKQMDAPYLEELLEWFILGDGRDRRNYEESKYVNMFSISKRLIEDLHEIVIKIGGSGNWTEKNTEEDYIFADHLVEAKNKSTLYQLNLSTTKGIYLAEKSMEIIEEDYSGNIYCLTVENGNFYIKQNNKAFLTGNSSPKINVRDISHVITKLALVNDGAVIGEAEALDTDPGVHLQKLMKARIRLGVSTRGVGNVEPYRGPLGEGLVTVKPGYKMRAIDIVFDPSQESYPNFVTEETNHKIILGSTVKFRKIWTDVFGK